MRFMNARVTPRLRGWFKASASNQSSACVEVRFSDGEVLVRDSKQRSDADSGQPMVVIPTASWSRFLDAAVRRAPATVDGLALAPARDGGMSVRAADGTVLTYTPAE
ncbi:DUF397 domain-containing protein [Nocardia cyriacigeorgica]|nr:DUF397 domain-containing protein [Nocardia cyriacigeorgica]